MRALLLLRTGADARLTDELPADEVAWLRERAPAWSVGVLMQLVQTLSDALARTRDAAQFQVQTEVALLTACDVESLARVLGTPRFRERADRLRPCAALEPVVDGPPSLPWSSASRPSPASRAQPVVAGHRRCARASTDAPIVPGSCRRGRRAARSLARCRRTASNGRNGLLASIVRSAHRLRSTTAS